MRYQKLKILQADIRFCRPNVTRILSVEWKVEVRYEGRLRKDVAAFWWHVLGGTEEDDKHY
jgi:hypothetical protein